LNNPSKTGEGNGKSLAAMVAEIKSDVTQFLQTRCQMLAAEMKEKAKSWKFALLLMLVTMLLAVVAFLLLTGAAVAALAAAVGVGWSLLIMGVAYLIFGSISAWVVYGEIKQQGITPVHTLQVLQEDKNWLQKEARSV
jgi:uncharacterized membrane protein YqjE